MFRFLFQQRVYMCLYKMRFFDSFVSPRETRSIPDIEYGSKVPYNCARRRKNVEISWKAGQVILRKTTRLTYIKFKKITTKKTKVTISTGRLCALKERKTPKRRIISWSIFQSLFRAGGLLQYQKIKAICMWLFWKEIV